MWFLTPYNQNNPFSPLICVCVFVFTDLLHHVAQHGPQAVEGSLGGQEGCSEARRQLRIAAYSWRTTVARQKATVKGQLSISIHVGPHAN